MRKLINIISLTVGISLSMSLLTQAATFSEYWFQDSTGNWHINDGNGNTIKNAWLCDDAIASNGQDIWYLIDSNGNMVSAGLVQDQTGNYYSLEVDSNGYKGMLRYKSGTYNGVYLDLESSHNGEFSKLKNQDGIDGLKGIHGLTQVNIDNSNCIYTSSFRNSSSGRSSSSNKSNNQTTSSYYHENENTYVDEHGFVRDKETNAVISAFTDEILKELAEINRDYIPYTGPRLRFD